MLNLIKVLFSSLWLQRLLGWVAIVSMMYQIHYGSAPGWYVWLLLVVFVLMEYISFYRGAEYGIIAFTRLSRQHQKEVLRLLEVDENDRTL
jgi:hypothetical protein